MIDLIRIYLPYVMSAVTIWQLHQAGQKRASNWLWGLGNQALWLIWILTAHAWGLLPMTAALVYLYSKNYRLWTRTS